MYQLYIYDIIANLSIELDPNMTRLIQILLFTSHWFFHIYKKII